MVFTDLHLTQEFKTLGMDNYLWVQALFNHKELEQLRGQEPTDCQEIGLVAFMFFFELLFSYVSSFISFYVSLTNLFSIILFPYLLITRDTQDEGEARFRFY